MSELEVRFIKLEPLRMASFWGFGAQPENIAWSKLEAWAKPRGLFGDLVNHPVYGFNNPNPSHGSPNYGYEVWIEVGPEVEPEGDMRIVDFCGGNFAVTRCDVPKGDFSVIFDTWQKLVAWQEASKYKYGNHQCLEKSVPYDTPGLEFALDLMLPITD